MSGSSKGFPPPSRGSRNAREPSFPHRPSLGAGREPPSIYLAICHPCRVDVSGSGVWGQVKAPVWTPRIWDIWGTLDLRGGRPDSATLCCPLSPSWQVDRGIYSSTTQPAGTHTGETSPLLVGRPLLETCRTTRMPVHPSQRWTHTDRLMENGVPPSVAVARLGQTETEVCLLRDRCALPQEVFPTRWLWVGCPSWPGRCETGGRDQRGEVAWVSPVHLLFKQCCWYRHGHRAGMGTVLA